MPDAQRPPPAAGPQSRARRVLVLLAVLLLVLAAVGFFYGRQLWCGLTGGCPAVAAPGAEETDGSARPTASAPFLLHLDSGVELDTDAPSEVTAAGGHLDDGDLFYDNRRPPSSSLYTADHPIAEWHGEGAPEAADCLDAIVSEGVWSADPKPGQVLCVQTTEGRIAALTVNQVLDDGVTFVSTVWN